ncbi:uncharacterized protein LOC124542833 [Vanessa cardui]|uniref:uncharacterized protein LOC124542833 n=1 Tax=Vanessa cardui TaxID=171605 RepID=UPI001F142379|nr:uncharacterized protein LOC124542833 [Vanessa cardui]
MADEENFQWNVENTILFIDCYKQKPILWDPTDINYYKNDLKNDAWSEIAKCLNTNVESCKHKITSLLSAFRREKNKTKKGKGTGKGASEVYKSKWYAYEAMSFLMDRDKPRNRRDSTQSTQFDFENEESQQLELSDQGETSAKRTKKESPRLGLLKQALGVLKKSSEKNMEERSGDPEVQHFCKFIASKLEKYSKNTQNMLQYEIFDLFRKADSGYYEYYNNNYGRSYGYNSSNVTDNVTDSHATEEQN